MPLNGPFLRSWPRAIVHIDGDAFFASCEQAVHPEWRGKPVICGKERGIVATASYEARAKGVTRGVALWDVKKLCPDAIIVPSDYETYSIFSKRMFEIMRRFTPLVEEYSIDEGFAEITGLRRPFHVSYQAIAQQMKEAIEKDLGITVSVGLSLSKTLAKVGSKWKKPSGLTAISGRHIHEYLAKLPLEKVWGIGPATTAHCRTLGMRTALDFARKTEAFIRAHFAKPQFETWQELNGESVLDIGTDLKSEYFTISKTKTFTPPSNKRSYVLAQLLKNLENACIKARRHGQVARGLIIYLKTQEFRYSGLEAALTRATAFPIEMTGLAQGLFDRLFKTNTLYRATGVVLTGLVSQDSIQLSLFDAAPKLERLSTLYKAIDSLADIMGKHCVYTAGAAAAHRTPQHTPSPMQGKRSGNPALVRGHVLDRGDVPLRKLARLKGETKRLHLRIPLLMHKVT